MKTTTAAPDPRQRPAAPSPAPWETDPDAWKGHPTEDPSEAVERLLREVREVRHG